MQSYAQIKEALLKHFKLSLLTHYIKFIHFEKDPKDTVNQFGNSLTEAFDLYLESKRIKDLKALHDDMILQKFIENLRGNIRRYVTDKDPQTLLEATKFCDHYVANISGSPGRTRKQSVLEIIHIKNRTMKVETLDSKEQHDSEEQTEGHSVRSEVAIIQAALIRINISRINHTNIFSTDTINMSIKVHQHQRMPRY